MFGLKRGLIAIHPELPWCPDDRTAVILQFSSMSFAHLGISRVAISKDVSRGSDRWSAKTNGARDPRAAPAAGNDQPSRLVADAGGRVIWSAPRGEIMIIDLPPWSDAHLYAKGALLVTSASWFGCYVPVFPGNRRSSRQS